MDYSETSCAGINPLYWLQMFEWISHNRDLFLVNYTEIGTCHQMAVELESEHGQFATSAEVCTYDPGAVAKWL